MPNEERPQDFELIELLIREVSSDVASTSTQQGSDFKSFKARFQSYIDQIPSYLHSVGKEGFFPHFFLGSFSTLINTEIAKKLKIKKIYFRFDTSGTLKVAVISNDKIQSYEDVKNHVKLISISEHNSDNKNCKFTSGDLVEILKKCLTSPKGKSIQAEAQDIKDAFKGPIDSVLEMDFRLIHISRNNINKEGINVEVIDTRVLNSAVSKGFHEVKGGLWSNPESDIAKLTNPDVEKVKEPIENILKKVSKIHSEYKDSLMYGEEKRTLSNGKKVTVQLRETAHHGFIAGALVNFRYRHNLRVYLEQFAGRGYADIVLVPRGKDRSLNAIPIIIEMKAATKAELEEGKIGEKSGTAPTTALKQAEDYTKGFQPNVMRILTTANDMLCVGVNLDHPSPVSNIVAKSRDQEITPLFNDIMESIDGRNNGRINEEGLKEKVQNNIERIYHTFPGTGEKGDNHYFSRFLLGQSLLLNEVQVLESSFKKHVFIYGENIPTEAQPEPKSQRLKDQKSKGQGAGQPSNLDQSHGVVTMVFIPINVQKSVCVMNIVETDGRDNAMNKGIPLDQLQQEIGNRKIVELNLSFNIKKKSKFEEYFSVEVGESASLEQYNRRETNKFEGNFKDIPYPTEFKETFDKVLESQLASSQDRSQSIGKYKESFEKLGEAMLPFKDLIEKEAHTQAVFHGVFSHYSDIKLGELQENRALVLTEFQTGRGKRIDMLVHGIKFADQASSAKEYDPVGLELKGPREGKTADALVKEANDQINTEYVKGVTYKTLTDGKEVGFIGVVFDKSVSNADSLILMSKDEFASVKVVHSSIFSFSQQQPRKKFDPNTCVGQGGRSRRSINNCLFSKGDVEKFSKGNIDENNVDKIIIDSEKFLTYVKSSQDKGKNAQLVEFIGNKNIEGDYKYLVDKVIGDQGYERYIQNERIKDLQSDVLQQNSGLTKNPKLKSRLMNAAGGIQLIRGIHGAIVSCKDGTATDCGLNLGGVGWSFASQPIENVMVKIAPKVVTSSEKVVARIVPGTLGRQTKFAVKLAGVKFGSTIAKGVAGAVAGVFDIIDIGISANNLVDCKNRESSDNPCGEKEIRDNIASIAFSGVSFVSGVALTAASLPGVGIGVGFGLMVTHGVYSGISNIMEYEKKYDTTHGENFDIFLHTLLLSSMPYDLEHLAARNNMVNSQAKRAWKALSDSPNDVVAYGVGFGVDSDTPSLHAGYGKILMNRTDANTTNLSRVIPDPIQNATMICLPQVTSEIYEKGIKKSVPTAVHHCENTMVIADRRRMQNGTIILYNLESIDEGTIVGSNTLNNYFLIFRGNTGITGGNNTVNKFILVKPGGFSGKIIGGSNATNILDLSQSTEYDFVQAKIDYRFRPNAPGLLRLTTNLH